MTTKKKTSILTLVKEYALVTLGMLLYVLAWTVFLMPNNLVGGGISGLSAMIQYATNGVLKSGYTYFVINVVLLIIGLFTLGKQFGIKTVYAIVITSVGLNVFQDLIPAEICQTLAVRQAHQLHDGRRSGRSRHRHSDVSGRKFRRN